MNGLSDPHGKGGVSARVWDLIVKYGPGIAVRNVPVAVEIGRQASIASGH
jgi:hypothetical protein